MKRPIRRKLKLLALARNWDTKNCIFCGSPSTTREHVFSQRFHKYLNPAPSGRTDAIVTTLGHTAEQTTFKLPGPMRDWQVKCVCGWTSTTCNNGWMRKLDAKMDASESRLMRLPREEDLPFRVLEPAQKIIATWAIMKVMVVHHVIIHHMQRKQMREKVEPPDGWGVWIGYYQRSKNSQGEWWVPRPFPVIRYDPLARRKFKVAKANSITTTIVLQNLFIHVVYCRDRRLATKWSFSGNIHGGPLQGNLFKIWPPPGYSIMWPSTPLTDQDAAVISDAILQGVMTVARRLGLVSADPPPVTQL
jgi:hypothetical protein